VAASSVQIRFALKTGHSDRQPPSLLWADCVEKGRRCDAGRSVIQSV
jgi:hypothetical protein